MTVTPSPMDAMTQAIVEAAGTAVELAISLIGITALFLGLMKIVEEAGLLTIIARIVKPITIRLFPDIPAEHPAMGAMIMNLSANFLGLGNAATPFGIKAMEELNKLNPVKGTATNAMVLFLALNTSCITLLPTTVIALRAETGSQNPAGIVVTTIFATVVATICSITASKFLQRFWPGGESRLSENTDAAAETSAQNVSVKAYPLWVSALAFLGIIATIPLMLLYGKLITPWIIPALIVAMLGFGLARKVPVYETFITGAKEGFDIAIRIMPYLIGILVAIGMFRKSGAMDTLIAPLGHFTAPLGLPAEGLTMAFLRTLSGSGSFGLLADFLKNPAIGPDSYTGYLTSTMYGSSETTFYVLAVYFGAVQIQRIRHALVIGLLADVAATIAAIVICTFLYGRS
jgi:spore maturation protein SpmA